MKSAIREFIEKYFVIHVEHDKYEKELLEAIAKDEGWVEIKEGCRMPETDDRVLIWNNNHLGVMTYEFIEADEDSGYAWSNCYGDVNGDPEFDDEYKPTHWRELPKPPHQ